MTYAKILMLVEGATELTFIRDVLNPYLFPEQISLVSKLVRTRQPRASQAAIKGGVSNYNKIENDLKPLLYDSSAIAVTTMFDLYALPADFPGQTDEELKTKHGAERAEYLENKWKKQFPEHYRFIPYLSVHEFEALLFTKPEIIAQEVPEIDEVTLKQLQAIRISFQNPEDINMKSPPSKRTIELIPGYRKIQDGKSIAETIGIEAMRKSCPHFDNWLKKLETLSHNHDK